MCVCSLDASAVAACAAWLLRLRRHVQPGRFGRAGARAAGPLSYAGKEIRCANPANCFRLFGGTEGSPRRPSPRPPEAACVGCMEAHARLALARLEWAL